MKASKPFTSIDQRISQRQTAAVAVTTIPIIRILAKCGGELSYGSPNRLGWRVRFAGRTY